MNTDDKIALLLAAAAAEPNVQRQIRKHLAKQGWQGAPELFARLGVQPALQRRDEILARCQKAGIDYTLLGTGSYPKALAHIPDAPLVLYYKGDISVCNLNSVAVVGSRAATPAACAMAQEFGTQIAQRDMSVVSGLAVGIDAAGHIGALQAYGITVGVLAHGLDRVHPAANAGLAQRIVDQGGALISEYEPGIKVNPRQLMYRNRIQTGLSQAVIVVQAAAKSGTMCTADYCRKHKRILATWSAPENAADPAFGGNTLLLAQSLARPVGADAPLAALLDDAQKAFSRKGE